MQKEGSTFDVLGVPVSVVTLESAAQRIEAWAADDIGRFVCIRDVASLMAISEDASLAPLHRDAAMVTPDGMPLVAIGKMKGYPVKRVCGPDLIAFVLSRSAGTGVRHYFYGGKEGVAEMMAERFSSFYPGARIVGCESPPFGDMSEAEVDAALERLRASEADVIWVGMSSPKQDLWMWTHHARLPATMIGVGAAFDFHSGEVKRAPRWMQVSGLEWAYRLSQEPHRLWRRYFVLAPRFVFKVAASSFGRRTRHD